MEVVSRLPRPCQSLMIFRGGSDALVVGFEGFM